MSLPASSILALVWAVGAEIGLPQTTLSVASLFFFRSILADPPNANHLVFFVTTHHF